MKKLFKCFVIMQLVCLCAMGMEEEERNLVLQNPENSLKGHVYAHTIEESTIDTAITTRQGKPPKCTKSHFLRYYNDVMDPHGTNEYLRCCDYRLPEKEQLLDIQSKSTKKFQEIVGEKLWNMKDNLSSEQWQKQCLNKHKEYKSLVLNKISCYETVIEWMYVTRSLNLLQQSMEMPL